MNRLSPDSVTNATPRELLKALLDGPRLFQWLDHRRLKMLTREEAERVQKRSEELSPSYMWMVLENFSFEERAVPV